MLFLQGSLGVEIWDLNPDPSHPVFLGRLAEDAPVSDLVAQGTRLFLAEGSARRISIWEVGDPSLPMLLSRREASGFANSIWPREDGQLIGILAENPAARFLTSRFDGPTYESGPALRQVHNVALRPDQTYQPGPVLVSDRVQGLVTVSAY